MSRFAFVTLAFLFFVLVACGGGSGDGAAPPSGGSGSGGGGTTMATIADATFDPTTSADFSRTAVGRLLETSFRYRVYGAVSTYTNTYVQMNVTASGVSMPCWYDGDAALWAVDTAGAIRQIGYATRPSGVLTPTLFTSTLPYFLPAGTLTNGQTFLMQPLTPSIVCTISLNQISREGATGCIKVLIASPYGPDPTITIYNEIWIKPSMGAMWTEKYRLSGSPTSLPSGGNIYAPVSG